MKLKWLQRIRFAPFFTQLVVTRRCNLHCGYCNEYDANSQPVPTELLQQRLDYLKALGAFSVCLTGGEPTLHPDLPALIHHARHSAKFFRTAMITNGTYLTQELVERLNDAGLQEMQISIDGVERNDVTVKVLDTLRGRLQILRDHARFHVVVSGVLGACPPHEAYEVIAYAKQMGFRPRVLVVHDAAGQGRLADDDAKAFTRIQKMIGRHPFELSAYRHRLITTGAAPFKCRAGSRYLYVDEHGMVAWCSQTRHVWQKPLSEYTPDDLREQFFTPKTCHAGCTLGCVRSSSALDEWRGQSASA